MFIAFIHFMANLIIALALLRLIEMWLADKYGSDHPAVKALAFTH